MHRAHAKEILFKTDSINFQLDPEEYGLDIISNRKNELDLTQYCQVSEVYREPLSATSLSIATTLDHNKVAIKKIYKEDLITGFQKRQAVQEFPLHCSLNHSNIVKGLEWSENDNEYVMVMEYMNNATYFQEKIDRNLTPVKNEIKMKSYIIDALEGLIYLHSKGITHGDIKLENMLVNTLDEDGSIPIIKLCDLGLARVLSEKNSKFLMETPVGSQSYMAPEIKANAYVDSKIDMWALGVVLYKMSVAYKPTQITGYKYGQGPIPFRKFDWKKRSHELQDFVTNLLEVDPEKRISAEEALQHPWFQI